MVDGEEENYENLAFEKSGDAKFSAAGKLPMAEPRNLSPKAPIYMNGETESGPRFHQDPILLPVKCQHGEQNIWKQPINIIMFIAVLVVFTIAVAALIDTKIRLHEVETKLELYTNLEVQGGGGGESRVIGEEETGGGGPQGEAGEKGDVGPPGSRGDTGVQGDRGITGEKGRAGLKGAPGRAGVPGADGQDGSRGNDGVDGSPGQNGQKGDHGLKGSRGYTGSKGQKGASGSSSSGVGGSSYIRWGRKDCPYGRTLLYEGFAAGTYATTSGGGTNYQCLPLDPDYKTYYTGSGGSFAYISGVEYESGSCGLFPSGADDENVPCARCYTSRSTSIMIPAKTTCPSGWTEEYDGYLMTAYSGSSHQRTTFECVDESPQYVSGLGSNYNGAQFYFVRPDCSSEGTIGHCSPYGNYYENRQLTCVVCSK